MFRREWRQQLLVLTLLAVAVAAAIGSITIAYNASCRRQRRVRLGQPPAQVRRHRSAKARRRGSTPPGSRSERSTSSATAPSPSPAASRRVDFRAQDPDGAYGGELLALRHGSYPEGPGRSPSPTGWPSLLALEIGSTLALDGRRRTVVGIVENPRKLSDEFALVSPSSAERPTASTCSSTRDAAIARSLSSS